MILIECNRNHNLSIIFQPITAQYKKKAWQKEELFGFWYAVSLKRVMIWNSTFAFTLVNMHTKLLDYNRKGRGRYDPIFKGVNICICIWTNFCTPCEVMVLNQRILLCVWLFFKQKGHIYCPHSTVWLTSYKIVRITGWKRAIRKQIHACTYMYTQWLVL